MGDKESSWVEFLENVLTRRSAISFVGVTSRLWRKGIYFCL